MLQKMTAILVLMLSLFSQNGLSVELNTGPWRFEQQTGFATIPFVIHFRKEGENLAGTLHNGKEKIELTDIQFDPKTGRLHIPLQTYEQSLQLEVKNQNSMKGMHIRHNKSPEVKTIVTGTHGVDQRFPESSKMPVPSIDLTGRWSVDMIDEDGKKSQGIVIFEQKGKDLNGSILTPTGDYRYFNGYVSGNDFEAASFDGVFNYLFKGKVRGKKLDAAILANYQTGIQGERNPKATLPDAYKQTQIKQLKFSFPDLQGKQVSLSDSQFAGKPVIVQFFGSWCPNCMDEMNYLIPWYQENKNRGIEVIALAFERSLDKPTAIRQLKKVQDKKQVPYPMLVAGYTAEDKPMDKIKGLKNFISFPTTVFLNKKHEVVKVHAGFTGPSTGEFFEKWKSEFNHTVNELLKK